jgi:hypothetical protein
LTPREFLRMWAERELASIRESGSNLITPIAVIVLPYIESARAVESVTWEDVLSIIGTYKFVDTLAWLLAFKDFHVLQVLVSILSESLNNENMCPLVKALLPSISRVAPEIMPVLPRGVC